MLFRRYWQKLSQRQCARSLNRRMSDVFSPAKRSQVMSRIRARNNASTELNLVAILRAAKLHGWRRNQLIFGRPDFVFRKHKLAIFVDGCFWHGCPKCYRVPRQNQEFWASKLAKNRDRDRLVNRYLRASGWKVIRLWEHELRPRHVEKKAFAKKIDDIASVVMNDRKIEA